MNLKLNNINEDDLILAVKAARAFAKEGKPIGIRHGTVYCYGYLEDGNYETVFYVYGTKTMIVVRGDVK